MTEKNGDPYAVLGVAPDVADAELRAAYRRLAQLHHPDHNGGSAESAQRFEAVQVAYAQVLEGRRAQTAPAPGPSAAGAVDPGVEGRIAALERELAAQRQARAREAAARAAQQASDPRVRTGARPSRATPEELGQYETDDSLTEILSDAETELAKRFAQARRHPLARRLTDLFGGSGENH
jgi:hypothetical protein